MDTDWDYLSHSPVQMGSLCFIQFSFSVERGLPFGVQMAAWTRSYSRIKTFIRTGDVVCRSLLDEGIAGKQPLISG